MYEIHSYIVLYIIVMITRTIKSIVAFALFMSFYAIAALVASVIVPPVGALLMTMLVPAIVVGILLTPLYIVFGD